MSDAVLEWFDSHCHLQDEYLEAASSDGPSGGLHATPLNAALARASQAGVTRLVCVGTDAVSSAQAVALARSLGAPGSAARAEDIEAWNDSLPHLALEATWRLIRETNAELETAEPWKAEPGPEVDAVLGSAIEVLRIVALLVTPAMPTAADEIWRRIGLSGSHSKG
ncbi:MAG TPA: hypothetical protein VHZ02_13805, partial [Acidimicrobiales bacterium]|nr:hypothetical protein [Acidimicrobiales bacterium]